MPPALVGGFIATVSSVSLASATAFVAAVYTGAAIGAVLGAATALVTGGNILKGAVSGAVVGGITAGIGNAVGQAAKGAMGVAKVGDAGVKAANLGATEMAAASKAAEGYTALNTVGDAAKQMSQIGGQAAQAGTQAGTGLLSRAVDAIRTSPNIAKIGGEALSGAAKAMLESRTRDKELDFLMERDRLNREAEQIDLTGMGNDFRLPSVGEFTERPAWQMEDAGLLPPRT